MMAENKCKSMGAGMMPPIGRPNVRSWSKVKPDEPKWEYWLKRDLWYLSEGIWLLMRIEPKEVLQGDWDKFRDESRLRETEDEIASLVRDAISMGKLQLFSKSNRTIQPAVFVKWASKDIEIPPELKPLLELQDPEPAQEEVHCGKQLRNDQLDKQLCQAIAKTLWDIYPEMTIEDMKKHKAIQQHGNGRLYGGKNTLRGWLSEVDPRPPEKKTGRPKH